MLAFLGAAAAKIANPPPWPDFSPDALRDIASIQEAVLIEKEVSKGGAGNPTVVARADLLRQDVWNRWRAAAGIAPGGEPLSNVLGKLTEVADRQLAILEQTSATSTSRRLRNFRPVKPEPTHAVAAPNAETSTAPKFSVAVRKPDVAARKLFPGVNSHPASPLAESGLRQRAQPRGPPLRLAMREHPKPHPNRSA